jgi:hypothetical protein
LNVPLHGRNAADFVPAEYSLVQSQNVDLNGDGKEDLIVVEERERLPFKIVLLAFRTDSDYVYVSGTGLTLMSSNFDMRVHNTVLTIEQTRGANPERVMQHKFKYISGKYYLVGYSFTQFDKDNDCDDLESGSPGEYDIEVDYLTRTCHERKVSEKCKIVFDKTYKIPKTKLQKMTECCKGLDTDSFIFNKSYLPPTPK